MRWLATKKLLKSRFIKKLICFLHILRYDKDYYIHKVENELQENTF